MNCQDARPLLAARQDREIDADDSRRLDDHLAGCAGCAAVAQRAQALSGGVRASAEYHRAPPELALRIEAALALAQGATAGPREETAQAGAGIGSRGTALLGWLKGVALPRGFGSGFGLGTAAGVLMAGLVAVTVPLSRPETATSLEDQIVAGHARALLTLHVADVASSDHHTVKPWFSGRIDYAPPVRDLASEGFPLTGGRMDYVAGRPVAVLVYGHGAHTIDLFVWPQDGSAPVASMGDTRKGYSIRHFTRDGMTYWAISDADPTELERFAALLLGAT